MRFRGRRKSAESCYSIMLTLKASVLQRERDERGLSPSILAPKKRLEDCLVRTASKLYDKEMVCLGGDRFILEKCCMFCWSR